MVLLAGTNGLSVWSSDDLGETIGRLPSSSGMYSGSQVWSLAYSPQEEGIVYAGADSGIYKMDVAVGHWKLLARLPDVHLVTAIAVDPANPGTLLAGSQPAGLFRSDDHGHTWERLSVDIAPYVSSGFYAGDRATETTSSETSDVKHWARVTDIVFDSMEPNVVLAGVEIDGAWRSVDGGRTWQRAANGLVTNDIHGFSVVHAVDGQRTFFSTTCDGLHASSDAGISWTLKPLDSPWQYTRTVRQRADQSGVVFVTNGNGPPGTNGRLFRSRDYGSTWENVPLPVDPESSLYFMAVHPADPNLIFAATNLGQIFRSIDGGEKWTVIPRRLPEVRALAWMPS